MARRCVPAPTFLSSTCASTLNPKLAVVNFEQLGSDGDRLALWGGGKVLDIHFKPNCGVALAQNGLYRLNAGAFHQADHRWGRKHAIATSVFHHQAVVDHGGDLSGNAVECERGVS